MGVQKCLCAILLTASILRQVRASDKIDFKSIFHTPQRKYDEFEILERSCFEPDDQIATKDLAKCLNERPRAIANAQVLVNFGNQRRPKCDDHHPQTYFLHHDPAQPNPMPYPHPYHAPQCHHHFSNYYYPSQCSSPTPGQKLPATVSKSCTVNFQHAIQALVDPKQMYDLTIPCDFLRPVDHKGGPKVFPVDLGVVEMPTVIPEVCSCHDAVKDGKTLAKAVEGQEEIIFIDEVPPKTDKQIILVDQALPETDEKFVLIDQAVPDIAKEDDKIVLLDDSSNKSIGEEKLIFVAGGETHEEECDVPKFQGFDDLPDTQALSYEIQPAPKKTPMPPETQKRILCTVENLINHLVNDDFDGMEACEKLRIAEVLTQVLVNLRSEAEPSSMNDESLRVFFDFIKKVQDEYTGKSVAQISTRSGGPVPTPPHGPSLLSADGKASDLPLGYLDQIQKHISGALKDPKKDEESAKQYSLLLLNYIKNMHGHEKKDVIPITEQAAPTTPADLTTTTERPIAKQLAVSKEPSREDIRKKILSEISVPLLNQYVTQLNLDRVKEKPLTNEDVINLWIDSTLKLLRKKNIKEEGHGDEGTVEKKEAEIKEEINLYKHIVEAKPTEQDSKKANVDEICTTTTTTTTTQAPIKYDDTSKNKEAEPAREEQKIVFVQEIKPIKGEVKKTDEKIKEDLDMALLMKYLHQLNSNVADDKVVGEEKPKVLVDTAFLRPFVKIENPTEPERPASKFIHVAEESQVANPTVAEEQLENLKHNNTAYLQPFVKIKDAEHGQPSAKKFVHVAEENGGTSPKTFDRSGSSKNEDTDSKFVKIGSAAESQGLEFMHVGVEPEFVQDTASHRPLVKIEHPKDPKRPEYIYIADKIEGANSKSNAQAKLIEDAVKQVSFYGNPVSKKTKEEILIEADVYENPKDPIDIGDVIMESVRSSLPQSIVKNDDNNKLIEDAIRQVEFYRNLKPESSSHPVPMKSTEAGAMEDVINEANIFEDLKQPIYIGDVIIPPSTLKNEDGNRLIEDAIKQAEFYRNLKQQSSHPVSKKAIEESIIEDAIKTADIYKNLKHPLDIGDALIKSAGSSLSKTALKNEDDEGLIEDAIKRAEFYRSFESQKPEDLSTSVIEEAIKRAQIYKNLQQPSTLKQETDFDFALIEDAIRQAEFYADLKQSNEEIREKIEGESKLNVHDSIDDLKETERVRTIEHAIQQASLYDSLKGHEDDFIEAAVREADKYRAIEDSLIQEEIRKSLTALKRKSEHDRLIEDAIKTAELDSPVLDSKKKKEYVLVDDDSSSASNQARNEEALMADAIRQADFYRNFRRNYNLLRDEREKEFEDSIVEDAIRKAETYEDDLRRSKNEEKLVHVGDAMVEGPAALGFLNVKQHDDVEIEDAKCQSSENATQEDDMGKILHDLEYIKLKLDDLEQLKACRCEEKAVGHDFGKLETPTGYEILTPKSCKCYKCAPQGLPKRVFPHDIDDLGKDSEGPNIFDLISPKSLGRPDPEVNVASSSAYYPQVESQSLPFDGDVCKCGRKIERGGRCPSCAPYIREFNE